MKIALIQQRAGRDIAANQARGIESTRKAAAAGANLIVFPELAFLPFFPQFESLAEARGWAESIPGPTTRIFSSLAADLGVVIVLNLYEVEGDNTYDASPVIDADGSLLGTTRMVHIIDAPCFHEKAFYTPGDRGAPVYDTAVGKVGVAICYDRHYPEYMRALGVKGAEIVAVPQAGSVGEWPPGLFEAELQVAGFQNGYFTALANRVGEEERLTFAGESFVADPAGRLVAQAPRGEEAILYADIDLRQASQSHARRHFLADRRPGLQL